MTHKARWCVERALMNRYFPSFAAINNGGTLGFYGYVSGLRTGRLYLVTVMVPAVRYPETEPALYIDPRIGNCWLIDNVNHDARGKLSVERDTPWNPRVGTFASCVLYAIQYLKEFDQ